MNMPRRFNNWKFKQVEAFLKNKSFQYLHTQGSHYIYSGYVDGAMRMVVVPRHDGKSIPLGTMKAIVKQSGLSEAAWLAKT